MLHVARNIAGIFLLFILTGCGQDPPVEDRTAVSTDPVYLNHDPAVSYVGIDACGQCHAQQYDTYVESQMGQSMKPATRQNSAADFENVRPIYDPAFDFHYLPFLSGDELFVKEFRLAGRDTTHLRVEKIDYIVGSGQHTNSHFMDVNGYLYQVPVTWYTQEQRWDLPPGFDEGHSWRFSRAIEIECMTCHNALPEYVEGSDNRYRDVPHGIDCERCHGPGELHIERIQSGEIINVNEEIDPSIVNPAKLPRDLQFDVCQRCHLQGIAVPREGFSFEDFRPGMRLGDVIDVYFPRYTDSLTQFIMASHPDRLRMSECTVPSETDPLAREPLPCITCHDPHVPIESLGRDYYNSACQTCHAEPTPQEVCSEDLAVRNAVQDDCSGCHMPLVESIDIPHVRITDHNIRVPDDTTAQTEVEKRFVRLASLTRTNPSSLHLGEGYLAYYEQFNNVQQFLDSAAVQLQEARREESIDNMVRPLVRLLYLQEDYTAITALADSIDLGAYQDPWTQYRIGEAFANTNNASGARMYYENAVAMAPDHLWFRTKLASSYVSLGELDTAIAVMDAVLADNPKFQPGYNNRGYAYLLKRDFQHAAADFQQALSLNPDAEQPLANLASLYFNTGRSSEALPLARRLVQLDPGNSRYQLFLDAVREAQPS